MIIILYLSIALIAIAFLVLVIYLSKTLRSLKVSLDHVAGTLAGLEKQVESITTETTVLLKKTNALADDLHQKSQSINSVVDAVKDVGNTIQKVNGSIQTVSESVTYKVQQNQDKVAQVIQWGSVIIDIWDKWKDKRQKDDLHSHADKKSDINL